MLLASNMEVTTILDQLHRNADTTLLTRLKELTRDASNAQLYTRDSIELLCTFATSGEIEAQRCVANALALNDNVVQYVLPKLSVLLEHEANFDRFILLRILFLVTAKGRCSCEVSLLRKYLKEAGDNLWTIELLKTIYNVMLFGHEKFDDKQLALLLCYPRLVPHLINLLTEQEFTDYQSIKDIFAGYVDAMLDDQPWHGIPIRDEEMLPMLKVVSSLQPSDLIVPSSERDRPLGQSSSLAARLLRLLNTSTVAVREGVAMLLYTISGTPEKFVENVGYGHAIGFLTAHGLVPKLASKHAGQEINPVTGQNLRNEPTFAEMTDEEKEREAEKLFVLFQRMKKNGVISVEDPIQQAVDSGRFHEL